MSMPVSRDRFAEAYELMRTGILYMFIAVIVFIAGLISLFILLFAIVPPSWWVVERISFNTFFTTPFIVFMLILLAGAIVALIGLWGKFLPGVKVLKEIQHDFSTAETLVKLGYFWGLILLVISIPLIPFIVGIFTGIIAIVLILIGYIGLIILCFKLKELEREDLYLVAGILLIVGIFLSIAVIIAWILLYIALGNSIEKRKRGQAPIPPLPLVPPP